MPEPGRPPTTAVSSDAVPAIPEMVLLGLATALVMGLTDGAYCIANRTGQLVSPLEVAIACAHLVTLYLPLGAAAGLALGLVLGLVRRTSWLDGIRLALASPRTWATPRPEAFSSAVASLVAIGVAVPAIAALHIHFATRYHRADLAAYALAAAILGVALGLVLVVAAVDLAVRPLARRMGRVASLATLVGLFVVAAIGAPSVFFAIRPEVVDAYGAPTIAMVPAILIALGSLAVPIRRRLRRGIGQRGVRWAWTRALGAAGLALVLFALTAATYGGSNRVRAVVEGRAVLGQRLVRAFARWTDADGDGYAWAFGGGDCDDARRDVYPGALDAEGDGVDADCFAGDGSPRVAEEGDGHYGRVPARRGQLNFLVVTIDALRPDHLGLHGYSRDTSPNLDRFAEGAVVFETARAPSSRSIRSIPGMFTGLLPSQIAYGGEFLYPALLEENELVPEVLARRGYRRSVVMGTDYFFRCDGFFQGYDDVDQIMIYKPPRPRPVDDGLARLRSLAGQPSPWMLWVHLFNVHGPWLNDGAPSRYGDSDLDHYDTEIRHADEQVQRLFDAVHELGLDDRTVIVVASDHGEQFWEHGAIGHAQTLYEEEIRATLLIRAPGFAPRRVSTPVSMIDLAPTILNLAGAPMPRPTSARSLVPLMSGEPGDPERRFIGELVPDGLHPYDQRYMIEGSEKLLWWVREGRYELYDLVEDPGEHRDLSSDRPERYREMQGLLRAWVWQAARPDMRLEEILARNRLDAPPIGISNPTEVVYPGLFTVLGWDLPRTSFVPGEVIPLDLYYRVDQETDLDLFFRVDIEGPPGYRVLPHFHGNHFPLDSRYHTDRWREGEILRDPVHIVIPADAHAPVRLTLRMTVWAPQENNRLLEGLAGGTPQSAIRLGEIELNPTTRAPVPRPPP